MTFIKDGMLEEEVEHIRYWEQVYATTNSEALKQRAAIILGIPLTVEERKEQE